MTSKGRAASRRPDELGAEGVVDAHHLRDLYATRPHRFGLDRRELTFRHGELDRELAAVTEPAVVEALLA